MKKELSLIETQQLFSSATMNPLNAYQKSREELVNGENFAKVAERLIKPGKKLSSAERLQIYNRQYWFRLIDCLYDDFPGVRAVIGEKKFYNVIIEYLNKYRSKSFSLRDLGNQMIVFLQENPHLLGARKKAATQMAQLEWAQIVAFDEEAWPLLDSNALADPKISDKNLHLQPYVSLLKLDFALDDLILSVRSEARDRGEASAEPVKRSKKSDRVILPPRSKTFLAVHRFNNIVHYKRLSKEQFKLLSLLHSGEKFGKALSRISRSFKDPSEFAQLLPAWFAEWGQLGWFGVPKDEPKDL